MCKRWPQPRRPDKCVRNVNARVSRDRRKRSFFASTPSWVHYVRLLEFYALYFSDHEEVFFRKSQKHFLRLILGVETNSTHSIVSPKKRIHIFFGLLSRTQMRHKYTQIAKCRNQNTWDCDLDTFIFGKFSNLVCWGCNLVCFDVQHTAFFLTNHH